MSHSTLPSRPSLEYLRKLGKDRLQALRETNPRAQLAEALLTVAQDHGFTSWRALKAEVDRRLGDLTSQWFGAVSRGDADTARTLLREDPALLHARQERHDQTALHIAGATGHIETIQLLLDAGADPNDAGDDAHIGVIGWATHVSVPGPPSKDAVALLIERGARHHIFSAIALGDLPVIRALVEEHPEALDQRLSSRHHGQTALHFAIARGRLDILDLLIALGADPDATDDNRETALEFARLRGDQEAAARLVAAGARQPAPVRPAPAAGLEDSIQSSTLVIGSSDVAATLAWYTSIGFTEVARYPTDGSGVFWGMATLGTVVVTFDVRGGRGAAGAALLIVTDRVREFYERFTTLQLGGGGVDFVRTLYEPEHGGVEFAIRDPNGLTLRFLQNSGAPSRPADSIE